MGLHGRLNDARDRRETDPLLQEGDECVLIGPSWVRYEPCVAFAGSRVAWAKVDDNFEPLDLAENINPKTRLILVNSPSNPTGSVFDREVLEEIRELPRFGIEVFMNRRIIAQQLAIAVTDWTHVTQSRKTEKLGFWKGVRAEWRMITDLLDVAYPRVLLSQTWQLLALRTDRPSASEYVLRFIRPGYNLR